MGLSHGGGPPVALGAVVAAATGGNVLQGALIGAAVGGLLGGLSIPYAVGRDTFVLLYTGGSAFAASAGFIGGVTGGLASKALQGARSPTAPEPSAPNPVLHFQQRAPQDQQQQEDYYDPSNSGPSYSYAGLGSGNLSVSKFNKSGGTMRDGLANDGIRERARTLNKQEEIRSNPPSVADSKRNDKQCHYILGVWQLFEGTSFISFAVSLTGAVGAATGGNPVTGLVAVEMAPIAWWGYEEIGHGWENLKGCF